MLDAHGIGGIKGNGQVSKYALTIQFNALELLQPWWEYYTNHTREDGDGRPLSLTVFNATRGQIKDIRIDSPPFWCNAVANSIDITYDGMICNATNTNPAFSGQK